MDSATSESTADSQGSDDKLDDNTDNPRPAVFLSDLTLKSCSSKEVSEDGFVGQSAQSVSGTMTTGEEKGVNFSSDVVEKVLGKKEAPLMDVDVPCYSLNVVVLDTYSCREEESEVGDMLAPPTTETDTTSDESISASETELDNAGSGNDGDVTVEKKVCGGSVYDRAQRDGIALEGIRSSFDGKAAVGTVLVRNDCFEKRVGVRHSSNGWASYQDTLTQWVETVMDGEFDRFQFRVEVPERGDYHMELAFFCNQYWDNNGGKNHVVSCTMF